MIPIIYNLGVIFLLIGLAIKFPAFLLNIQSLFHFGFSFSIIGLGFIFAFIVNSSNISIFKKLRLETKFSDEDKKYLLQMVKWFVIPIFFTGVMIIANKIAHIAPIANVQIILSIWLPFLIIVVDKKNLRETKKEFTEKNLQNIDNLLIQMSTSVVNLYNHYKIMFKKIVNNNLQSNEKKSYLNNMNWAHNQISSLLITYSRLADFDKLNGLLPGTQHSLYELKINIDQLQDNQDQDTIRPLIDKIRRLAMNIGTLGHDRPNLETRFNHKFREILS